jgi:DNA-directed RNA polymerase specialized sigma24 family protein
VRERSAWSRSELAEQFAARAPGLRRTAYLLCGDWSRAEDLVQTVFANVYARRRRLRSREALGSYLRQALTRTYLDASARHWKREHATGELPDVALPHDAAGTMTRQPCGDPDFASGVTCTETHLAGDAILSVRGLFDYEGVETYEIAVTHADGSGVGAESGNFTLHPVSTIKKFTPSLKRQLIKPDTSRPHPTYDGTQLAKIVEAVDTATHH